MRIAFLANGFLNPDDPRSWYGRPCLMRRTLEEAGIEIITLNSGDVAHSRRWAHLLYWRWFHRKRFLRGCDPGLLMSHARQYQRRLAGLAVDAVFSPGTWPLAYLETRLPTVMWTDACFAGRQDFSESFSNLAPPSIATAHAVEQRALRHCHRAIFSNDWAANTARKNYRIAPLAVRVAPFGATLREPPAPAEALAGVKQRPRDTCRLLLAGTDWERQGARLAVEVSVVLNAAGVPCRLAIAGCTPPAREAIPAGVELIPFPGRASAEDRRRLNELYVRSHFFLMPSRTESSEITCAEANAFGVPGLGLRPGGFPSVIRDGINGRFFSPAASAADYAAWIAETWRDPSRYDALASRTAEDAAARSSWSDSGQQVAGLIAEIAGGSDTFQRPRRRSRAWAAFPARHPK